MKMQVLRTGRIGRVVDTVVFAGYTMYELAFEGQLWTEAFFASEVKEVGDD
jgi:hypothetical protein